MIAYCYITGAPMNVVHSWDWQGNRIIHFIYLENTYVSGKNRY